MVKLHNEISTWKSFELDIEQDKFSSSLRHLKIDDMMRLFNLAVFSLHPTSEDICSNHHISDAIMSQVRWVKDGVMCSEFLTLGSVVPIIDPIDKRAWLEDNLYLMDRIVDELSPKI